MIHQNLPIIQGSANRWAAGLVNFVPAVAYHFNLGLAEAFSQPGARLFANICTLIMKLRKQART